jgi:hypothetical protein
MSSETVKSIHYKIDNYKMESGWVTGANIKHFATAYMVYKVNKNLNHSKNLYYKIFLYFKDYCARSLYC